MTTQPQSRSKATKIALIVLVILLAVVPLFLNPTSEFGGADGAANDTILEIAPDTHPWFEPLWSPPSGEVESLLFALQAALGAAFIGYTFGYFRGRRQPSPDSHARH